MASKLRDAVRRVTATVGPNGATVNEIVDLLRQRFPEIVEQHAEPILRAGLSEVVRSVLKSQQPIDENERQFVLPIDFQDLSIPKMIPISQGDGSTGDGLRWIPLRYAKIAHCRQYQKLLKVQIKHDTANERHFRLFLTAVAPVMEANPELTVEQAVEIIQRGPGPGRRPDQSDQHPPGP